MRVADQVKWTLAAAAASIAVLAGCRTAGDGEAPPAWKDMTHEQRVAHMKTVVLPGMKAEFAEWEPEEFAEMNCATCHGSGAREGDFSMPNAKLPRLPGGPDGFERLLAEEPEATRFMANVVVPKMAAMLGETPYDPATHKGFGCFDCHLTK